MSELNKPSINEDSKLPAETKKKIVMGVVLAVVMIVLGVLAVKQINKNREETPPVIQETVPEDFVFDVDNMHVAKSSWREGSWCAVDKETVTSIHIQPEYDGPSQTVWVVDEMLFYQTAEGDVYITVGPGVHMLGSMKSAFANFPNATSITGLEYLETSAVTDMSYLFSESSFESVDISTWDTSSVTNFAYMLYNTCNILEVNMNNLDLSNVVDMSYIFSKCEGVDNIYFENVDTSHIVTMEGAFDGVGATAPKGITTLHGTIDTSSCTNMAYMFRWAHLTNVNDIVKDFDTSKVTNMKGMFEHSLNLFELDLSNWDVSKVTDMSDMFCDISCLITLNMEGWNPVSLISANKMFWGCYNLRAFNQWISAPNIQYANSMFENCFEMLDLDVTCFDGATFKEADRMFYCVQYVKHIYSNGFTVEEYSYDMFEWCVNIEGPTPYTEEDFSSDMAHTAGYLTPVKK